MKKFVKLLLLVCVSFAFIACQKEETVKKSNDDKEVTDTRYYVKYVVSPKSIYIFKNGSITVSTDKGSATFSQVSMDETFGPVSKGFVCSLKAKHLSDESMALAQTTYNAYIYVSYNNEPFALKASTSVDSKKDINLIYTIDF